ncbi:MAG: dienelactone hydrolase family protein [candidate division NC10 bacterium]|nr:dienelactone hydrolase family protein [candidate division NC10 bacterium]
MADKFRQTLVRLLGRTPARAALQPKVLERVALSGFVREKVSYMVEPGQRVSAYLFLPAGEGRHPAVLCLHQHNREYHLGKSEPAGLSGNPEQFYALELTKRGYVTLAPDAICFEERQHPTLRAQDYERFEATKRLTEGSCLQAKMLWDLQRALDYLTTRREVDRRRIGCLGHSLGGQEALFLGAVDRRIAVGVSNCGFSSYRAIFDAAILHNFAAYVPGLLRYGDLDRVLGLVAPRPFLVLAGSVDPLYPLEGVQATMRGARRVYTGVKDRLRLDVFPASHGFPAPMREAAYAWFDRWLVRGR